MVNHNQGAAIRLYLGHGQGNRVVCIQDNGQVIYYGSTDEDDHSHEFWHSGGPAARLLREIELGTGTPP